VEISLSNLTIDDKGRDVNGVQIGLFNFSSGNAVQIGIFNKLNRDSGNVSSFGLNLPLK
jgi:hypothetical protein